MIEKRFTLRSVGNLDYGIADNDDPIGSLANICELLNKLSDENERLKKQNNQTTEILENGGVILTKHQLTSLIEMKEESSEIRYLKTTNAKLKDEMKALKTENERLKSELFEAEKDYILETYADNPIRRDEKLKALEKELEE